MLDPGEYSGTYDSDAGNAALDFANTKSMRGSDKAHEWLDTVSNLIVWAELVGILSEESAVRLQEISVTQPKDAEAARLKAIDLREIIYRIFSAAAAGTSPTEVDVERFNSFISEAFANLRLASDDSAFDWVWSNAQSPYDQILWPVIKVSADILTSDQLGRVGECHGEGCGWLFLDMSRNHSRRWCSMNDCGNREKARRHYHRKRQV